MVVFPVYRIFNLNYDTAIHTLSNHTVTPNDMIEISTVPFSATMINVIDNKSAPSYSLISTALELHSGYRIFLTNLFGQNTQSSRHSTLIRFLDYCLFLDISSHGGSIC